jgi:hypothetical protein
MQTLDRWTEILRCPQCKNEGQTVLAQLLDTLDVMVESISAGFKTVMGEFGLNFHCAGCDAPVQD